MGTKSKNAGIRLLRVLLQPRGLWRSCQSLKLAVWKCLYTFRCVMARRSWHFTSWTRKISRCLPNAVFWIIVRNPCCKHPPASRAPTPSQNATQLRGIGCPACLEHRSESTKDTRNKGKTDSCTSFLSDQVGEPLTRWSQDISGMFLVPLRANLIGQPYRHISFSTNADSTVQHQCQCQTQLQPTSAFGAFTGRAPCLQ